MIDDKVQGQEFDTSAGNDFNAFSFIAQQIINLISTAKVVRVVSCTNDGGVSPVGFVDVQPLVAQIDGAGKVVPHGIVHRLPYSRLQGGSSAVILDPKPGDIGVAVFADRDISVVKNTKDLSPPGSFRKYAMADGIYLGMVLNAAPIQYVQFTDLGINMVSPSAISLQAPTISLQASASIMVNSPSNAIEGGGTSIDGKAFLPHEHTGVRAGPDNSGGVA